MSERRPSGRVAALAIGGLLVCNAGLVALAFLFRQSVAPGWKKGPLIDPASPYAPENAMVLFAFASCLLLDAYVLAFGGLRRRAERPRAWMAGAALVGAFALAEAGVRGWLALDMVTYFRPHPELHWVVRPNLRDFDNLTGGGRITTNADGLREGPPTRAKPEDTYRVLVLGDSSNFGHGVEGKEVWARVLQDLVPTHEGKRLEVVNGATPGWTTFQAVKFLEGTGLAYAPDLVIAGFNNDPGPEYLGDAARLPPPAVRALHGLLFRSEVYLLGREVALATARRLAGTAEVRQAGDLPRYGKLPEAEARKLVPRVAKETFLENLSALAELSPKFAWIDMPVNREEPELVERYVDVSYREAARALAKDRGFRWVGVDARWRATRERGLFQPGHVFHPGGKGHARLAQQVASELLGAPVDVEGPEPLPDPAVLRFGVSSLTPVHAHVAAVLQARPELAERHGLALQLRTYGTGKLQGEEVENGTLDAFFSCEVPAIRMLEGRPDAWVVGSPGVLGRIAVVSRVGSLAELAGKRVGLSPGSTPAMDWEAWSASTPGAQVVPLDTDALQEALASGQVDAIVGWDPWVERWRKEIPGAKILAERPFRSVLAVSSRWMEEARNPGAGGQPPSRSPLDGDLRGRGRSLAALGAASPSGARVLPMLAAQGPSGPNRGGMPATPPGVAAPGPVARLVALVGEALAIAARDRPRWDAEVAKLSGWSVEVVRAVADQDPLLAPCGDDVPCAAELPGALLPVPADREGLARAGRYARAPFPGEALVAEALLEGKRPQPRPVAGHMPGPPKTPPGVPPPMPPVPGR